MTTQEYAAVYERAAQMTLADVAALRGLTAPQAARIAAELGLSLRGDSARNRLCGRVYERHYTAERVRLGLGR